MSMEFSLEDLAQLDTEIVDVDADARTDDRPALPSDGTHQCAVKLGKVSDDKKLKLQVEGEKFGEGWVTFTGKDSPKKSNHVRLYLTFMVPNDDGVALPINAYPSSEPDRRNPSATQFDDILRDITGSVGIGLTAGQKAQVILQHVAAGGLINVTTEQRAKYPTGEKGPSGYDKEKVLYYGQKNHPPKVNSKGEVIGTIVFDKKMVEVDGVERPLTTSVEIVAYGRRD